MRVKVEGNCYDQEFEAVPAYTPLELVQIFAVDFVHVVRKHKLRILHSFDEQILAEITDQLQLLTQAVARESRLKATLEKASSGSFNKVWAPVGGERFSSLHISFAPVYLRQCPPRAEWKPTSRLSITEGMISTRRCLISCLKECCLPGRGRI